MSRDVQLQAEVLAALAPSHPGETSSPSLTVTTPEALFKLSKGNSEVQCRYDSMASYMKTVDGNHLVSLPALFLCRQREGGVTAQPDDAPDWCPMMQISTGEEGFFAVNSTLIQADPSGVPTQDAEQGRFW